MRFIRKPQRNNFMSVNDTLLQCFEWYLPEDGSFWKKVKALAPSFRNLGLTCIWLPPAYKGQGGIHDAGYGVYDLYDLGEFNQKGTVRTKYGTKQEYLDAISALHQNDLSVIVDVVLNHRMGADEKETVEAVQENPVNRKQNLTGPHQIETWTKFTFPGRKGKYSTFTWNHECFDGTDWDEEGHHNGIYRFVDKQWDDRVDTDNGNYDYLMGCDLDMSNPGVRKECEDWGSWYLNLTKADGVRLDAVKHIDQSFFEEWLAKMRQAVNNPNLFAVGEYWNGDINRLMYYLDANHNCLSLFDVALHFRFYDASHGFGNYDMGSIFNDTVVQRRPMNAVTFVDNHDTQPGQALTSFVEGWFKPLAYALILLRRDGLPCVFWGDLYGIPHDGIQPVTDLPVLIKTREYLAYGEECPYFDDRNVIGFTRTGDGEHPGSGLAVVMSDNTGGTKHMYVGKEHAGEIWVDLLGHVKQEVQIGQDGNADFSCEGGSVSVYAKRESADAVSQALK
jgi:alpha-amylase